MLTFFRHDRPKRRASDAGDVHRAGAGDFDGVGGGRRRLRVRRGTLRRREHRRPGRSVDKIVQRRRLRGRRGGGRRRGRRRRSGRGGGRRGRPLGGHRGGGRRAGQRLARLFGQVHAGWLARHWPLRPLADE